MDLRRAVTAVLSLVAVSFAVPLFADVTGTWSGRGFESGTCVQQNTSVPFSGPVDVTVVLLQSGSVINGTFAVANWLSFHQPDTCQGLFAGTLTGTVFGTISGSTLSLTSVWPPGPLQTGPFDVPVTAILVGSSMTFNFPSGSSMTSTLTQTSTQPPVSDLTGTYTGTFTDTIVPCGTQVSVTFSGAITAGLVQVGNALTGSITLSDTKQDTQDASGNCTLQDTGPGTASLSAQINGSSVTGVIIDPNGKVNTITATISGNTISGSSPGHYPGEGVTFSATRSGSGFPAPAVAGFGANPSTISAGTSSTLAWSTVNAAAVSIDNGIGAQPVSGSVNVTPSQTTTYTLTATGPGGSATSTATVTVTSGAPQIVIGTLPSGMLEAIGAGAIDSFTITNAGSAPGSVSLTPSGNFFSISPSTFTLNPGSSQVVTVTASAQPAGSYDGSVSVAPGGFNVPVHLLVASPPTAPVNPQPSAIRSDVSAPAGQNPSGSVSFTNNGAGTLTGIAVADVPWIVPQTGAITIAPGATQNVTFNIDRSKRPDAASPNGGVAGKISLVYLTNVASKGLITLGTTPTSSVSVTIVDVVKPGVSPGTPPPLQAGEVALFVDGLRTANRFNGDLTISALPSISSISDLQIFLSGTGSGTQVSAIPAFPSSGVLFPAITKNVFGVTGTAGGSLQLRSSKTPSIALAAIDSLNTSTPSISSATALPILRSDRSIAAGDRLVFAGAQDSATILWIQEVGGNAGHVSIQYLDANGAVVGTDSGSIPAFTSATSAAVDGTRTIVMTNDSSGPARFSGYAVFNDPTTNAGWVLTDPLHQWGSASGALIMPLVPAAGVPTDVYVVNPSTSPASVSVQVESAGRRRAVLSSGAAQSQSSMLAPMTTMHTTLASGNGFVRISSATPVSAIGRITMSSSGANFGSSVPAVPQSASLSAGQSKRFTAVDDSSARTVAAAVPGTSRSTLMLIETSGQAATVHVTLSYTFVAGGSVGAQGVSSRDFAIEPNQMLTVANLAQAVIGDQRSALGDLRNMQVDITVTSGSGAVLPFLASTDNASGDIIVRAE